MKKLLSLPPNLVSCFHDIEGKDRKEWFCTSDPVGARVGSGGGTAWLLAECRKEESTEAIDGWLSQDKKILIHAGGQSRRLPGYAPSGKVLSPIPVFRWERGQRLNQNLLDLQIPLYEKIMAKTPANINTLIASGDVFIRAEETLQNIPDADVVCYGLWADPSLATNHGVFVCDKYDQQRLLHMLQKPSQEKLQDVSRNHLFLMDIGIWLLSDRAVKLLMERSGYNVEGDYSAPENPAFYDLYSEFGLTLGTDPAVKDEALNELSVAILPLPGGEFYHYGTSRELISSTLKIQNRITDQRSILHKDNKPHPSIFIQNADVKIPINGEHQQLWIENSTLGKDWSLKHHHILTGIPNNNWELNLPEEMCLDIVPVGEEHYAIRPYALHDQFRGPIVEEKTQWMNASVKSWFENRGISLEEAKIEANIDIQSAEIFPLIKREQMTSEFINWMLFGKGAQYKEIYLEAERLSADLISEKANLSRLYAQREEFRKDNWSLLRKNHDKSVFYQLNLDHAAQDFARLDIPVSEEDVKVSHPVTQMHEQMFKARIKQYKGEAFDSEEKGAFEVLRQRVVEPAKHKKQLPALNVYQDQIVWGRSPVRIDLAGGWTDTPPYCILEGGKVVNLAINLNGQPPLQAFVKPCEEHKIIIRSIDLGTREDVTNWEQLAAYNLVGSAFSIPKAALCLCGFHPEYCEQQYSSLIHQLKAFGCGIEISMLAAIPKGSGLGTSSVLASTVLGALADFCGLGWDNNEICQRTLILEQLLTTGGGWQDQYGGVFPGVKLLETKQGINQLPSVRWTPDFLFTRPEYKACMLLYYTGITRTAKSILAEIVRGMFLNSSNHLSILQDMNEHALHTFDVLQRGSFNELADCVAYTWQQKQQIDTGTNPPAIQQLIAQINDLALGYKLPGAGGGGYMYIIAKDPEAAAKIKSRLNSNPPNNRARFVDMELSQTGFQVTRS
ncbi:bifunctional fucokinase/L-fucose-1-P-guanylyltransferase [Puteibacter caeruleilacunae]|nr:bifunctional fucokinase/L-fucose-1-P-guanylyltransferase [Puteibacter caeruleilacunae]